MGVAMGNGQTFVSLPKIETWEDGEPPIGKAQTSVNVWLVMLPNIPNSARCFLHLDTALEFMKEHKALTIQGVMFYSQ